MNNGTVREMIKEKKENFARRNYAQGAHRLNWRWPSFFQPSCCCSLAGWVAGQVAGERRDWSGFQLLRLRQRLLRGWVAEEIPVHLCNKCDLHEGANNSNSPFFLYILLTYKLNCKKLHVQLQLPLSFFPRGFFLHALYFVCSFFATPLNFCIKMAL